MKKLTFSLWASLLMAFSSASFAQIAIPITNAGTTGTTLASTAIVNSSNNAVIAGTGNTGVPTYIVAGGAGTTGQAQLGVLGQFSCTMDSTIASAAGWYYVVNSTTVAGDCHAQSAAPSSNVWVIGYLASASTTSGATSLVNVNGYVYGGSGGGTTTNSLTMNNGGAGASSGTTFNGGSAVTLSYNTLGAAPLASPTFTGTVTTPALTLSGGSFTGTTCLEQISGVVTSTGSACAGGGIPSGSTGQVPYYASSGTTVTPTSAITPTSASSGAPLGIGQTAPLAQIDMKGGENHLQANSALANITTTCSATAASCPVSSTAGLNSTGGYAIVGVNENNGEIVAYSSASGTTITFNTAATGCSGATAGRGCFGTTAASHDTGSQVVPEHEMFTTANGNLPSFQYYWYNGSPYFQFGNVNPGYGGSQSQLNFSFSGSLGATSFYTSASGTGSSNITQGTNGSLLIGDSSGATVGVSSSATSNYLTTATTITSTSFVTTNLTLASLPPTSSVIHGHCVIPYQQSSTNSTTFGIVTSAAPTALSVSSQDNIDNTTIASSTIIPFAVYSINTATTTAISNTDAALVANGNNVFRTDFLLSTGSTQVQLTIDAKTSAGTLTIEPGSYCGWDMI